MFFQHRLRAHGHMVQAMLLAGPFTAAGWLSGCGAAPVTAEASRDTPAEVSQAGETSASVAAELPATAATAPAGNPGMVAVIDPETGEFVAPTAADFEALGHDVPGAKAAEPQYETFVLPNGALGITVPESMYHNFSVTVDESGNFAAECTQPGDHATHNHDQHAGGK